MVSVSINTWTAAGSVGTAIAAAIGLITLFAVGQQSREAEAAQIREHLRAFRAAVTRTVALLQDGSPLIEAASLTAAAMRSRLGADATADDLRNLLSEESMALSAAVGG